MEARTADLDGDGNRDVIIVAEDDSAKMLLFGDGRGAFTDVTNRLDRRCVSNAVVAGDIDRDDDADIIYGCAGPDRVLINDGAGNFTDESAARLPPHPGGPAVVRSRIRVDSA
jgi:hypothetical protein